jgi:uncharacterized protein
MIKPTALPISLQERTHIVDVLRGFALLGVLLANFAAWIDNSIPPKLISAISEPVDILLNHINEIFINNKFITLFAILFGYGFGVVIERLSAKGINQTNFFLRRMWWLFLFGITHLCFFAGEILHFYALTGIFLLLFRNVKPHTLLKLAFIFIFMATWVVRYFQKFIIPEYFTDADLLQFYETIKNGSILDILSANFSYYQKIFIHQLVNIRDFFDILGKFLIGYYILRKQVLIHLQEHFPLIKKVWRWSIPFAALAILLYILYEAKITNEKITDYILYPVRRVGVLATSLFYATSIIILYLNHKWVKVFDAFRYVGSMSLTNYVTHTIIYLLVLSGIGLGKLGIWPLSILWIIAAILYAIQVIFSRWWLSRFRYGPVEWIWRQLAYRKRLPIRK